LRKRPLLSDVAEFPLARATRRDFDETLIQYPGKGKRGGQQRPIFQQAVASAVPAGAEGMKGDRGIPTQAAREGRPDGDVGTGERAIKEWDLQHLLRHHLNQPDLRLRQLLLREALLCLPQRLRLPLLLLVTARQRLRQRDLNKSCERP